jgi:hypothetical protein
MSGLIYDSSSISRINNLLDKQEEEFKKIDKEQDNKKIIRFGIILGVSVLSILLLKIIVKKKK